MDCEQRKNAWLKHHLLCHQPADPAVAPLVAVPAVAPVMVAPPAQPVPYAAPPLAVAAPVPVYAPAAAPCQPVCQPVRFARRNLSAGECLPAGSAVYRRSNVLPQQQMICEPVNGAASRCTALSKLRPARSEVRETGMWAAGIASPALPHDELAARLATGARFASSFGSQLSLWSCGASAEPSRRWVATMLRTVTVFFALVLLAGGLQADETIRCRHLWWNRWRNLGGGCKRQRIGKQAAIVEPGPASGRHDQRRTGRPRYQQQASHRRHLAQFYQRACSSTLIGPSWTHEEVGHGLSQLNRRKPGDDAMWTFEPTRGEAILHSRWSRRRRIPVRYSQRLDRTRRCCARRPEESWRSKWSRGPVYWAKMFIDAPPTEGDLMAAAGVGYHVGREANATYGETLNDVQLGSKKHQFTVDVQSLRHSPGQTGERPLAGSPLRRPRREQGAGDQPGAGVLACAPVPDQRCRRIGLPFPSPPGYDPSDHDVVGTARHSGWSKR